MYPAWRFSAGNHLPLNLLTCGYVESIMRILLAIITIVAMLLSHAPDSVAQWVGGTGCGVWAEG
ncbi:MAG: hypothetical protein DRP64_04380 [Verrucomicrobia bacterium]|nr:MAG: hypothetical protein DRP64_04380 [Verrucomicrobiota bacterium]